MLVTVTLHVIDSVALTQTFKVTDDEVVLADAQTTVVYVLCRDTQLLTDLREQLIHVVKRANLYLYGPLHILAARVGRLERHLVLLRCHLAS